MESKEQEESAPDTTELGRDTGLKFMKATNRTVIALLERQEALEDALMFLAREIDARFIKLTDYINEFILRDLLGNLLTKETAKYVTNARFTVRRINELEDCLKGFLQKYYQDGHPHTAKKTNKHKY